jgi:hypothetical protein
MTPTTITELPVFFSTNGLVAESNGAVSREDSGCCKSDTARGLRDISHRASSDSPPEIERELVKAQQRVEKGQVLGSKDVNRFRAILHNEPLRQNDIEFLTNQFAVAATYSADTPKPKISAAMFHLRAIRARLRNLISQPVKRGDCHKLMWYDARHADSTCCTS